MINGAAGIDEFGNVIANGEPLNADFTSDPIAFPQMLGFAIQAVWSGLAYGTFHLEYSCDPGILEVPPTNWTPDLESLVDINGDGSWLWDRPSAAFFWVRLCWVDTSSGTSNAILTSLTFNAKGI